MGSMEKMVLKALVGLLEHKVPKDRKETQDLKVIEEYKGLRVIKGNKDLRVNLENKDLRVHRDLSLVLPISHQIH
jgi:hypothetical protein